MIRSATKSVARPGRKTVATGADAAAFLAAVPNPVRRADGLALCAMMARETGEEAVVWGPSIIGFGRYAYRLANGRVAEQFLTGFAPRKAALVIYVMSGFASYESLLAMLGRHGTGRSCLYVTRLADVDMAILQELVRRSVAHMRVKHGV